MPDLSDRIQQARHKLTELADEFNRVGAELNSKAHSLAPDTYAANTDHLREQLIAIQTEIESTVAFIDRWV